MKRAGPSNSNNVWLGAILGGAGFLGVTALILSVFQPDDLVILPYIALYPTLLGATLGATTQRSFLLERKRAFGEAGTSCLVVSSVAMLVFFVYASVVPPYLFTNGHYSVEGPHPLGTPNTAPSLEWGVPGVWVGFLVLRGISLLMRNARQESR